MLTREDYEMTQAADYEIRESTGNGDKFLIGGAYVLLAASLFSGGFLAVISFLMAASVRMRDDRTVNAYIRKHAKSVLNIAFWGHFPIAIVITAATTVIVYFGLAEAWNEMRMASYISVAVVLLFGGILWTWSALKTFKGLSEFVDELFFYRNPTARF